MAFKGWTGKKGGIGGSGLDWLVHIRGQNSLHIQRLTD